MEMRKTINDIEPFKMWFEYTEEEKKILPPLNPQKIAEGNTSFWWNGKFWEYVPMD